MSFDLFTCCTNADDAKYIHPCACPTVSLQFQSEEIEGELHGYNEFYNPSNNVYYSSPPKRYLTITNTHNQTISCSNWTRYITVFANPTLNWTFNSNGSAYLSPPFTTYRLREVFNGTITDYYSGGTLPSDANNYAQSTTYSYNSFNTSYYCGSGITGTDVGTITTTLSNEDTEQNVINRESGTLGHKDSSLWTTRSTGYFFIHRTCAYTINCSNLFVGFNYKVTLTIKKRTAIMGSTSGVNYGTWEDVEVNPYTFTATATTETIDDNGNPIDVDLVQGYQYRVFDATIEKV